MKAIVLCAGLGTRMRPLTDTTPKCLLPVGGKPLLHHTLERLAETGVTDVAINLHHLPRAIVHDIKRGRQFGLRVTYSYEPELLGTAGAIKRLEWWLDDASSALSAGEPFFVVYGDEWTTIDFGDLMAVHYLLRPTCTVVAHQAEGSEGRNMLDIRQGRLVASIWGKGSAYVGRGWATSGIYALEPHALHYIRDDMDADLDDHLLPILIGLDFAVRAYYADPNTIIDIGKPEGYARANRLAGPSW